MAISTPTSTHGIACVLVTNLAARAERQRFPALRYSPLLLAVRQGQSDVVYDHSPEVLDVAAGMGLADALSSCPDAAVLPVDTEYYDEVFDKMAYSLEARCCNIERGDPGCLYADLEGLASIYGGGARLIASMLQVAPAEFEPRIGVAEGRFAAFVAAATASSGRAVRVTGNAAAFLSQHSVDLMPISSRGKERLRRWGVGTLGRLASVPESAVIARLGPEGSRAWELANGMDPRQLPDVSLIAA